MIETVKIVDNKNTSVGYLSEIPIFKNGKEFNFKPGINIIIGPNGVGKSTLFNLISDYLFCNRSIVSSIPNVFYEYPNLWSDDLDSKFRDGVVVNADFNSVLYRFRNSDSFQNQEIDNIHMFNMFINSRRMSTGEKIVSDLSIFFDFVFHNNKNEFPIKEMQRLKNNSNDVWKKKFSELLDYYVKNRIKYKSKEDYDNRFQFTILIDEPDKNLDIDNIESVYNVLSFQKEYTQLIAIVHNPILIYKLSKLDYINFIEFEDGYLQKIKNIINK